MKPTAYVETSIISYLTARKSTQLIARGMQEITLDWWDNDRQGFELYISQAVMEEISDGDPLSVQKRLAAINGLIEIPITEESLKLARLLLEHAKLPAKAKVDALHIAVATVNQLEYLLTWNCRHIANASFQKAMSKVCLAAGYELPVICTPVELRKEQKNA